MKSFIPDIVGPRMQACYKVIDNDGTVLGFTYRHPKKKGWWYETPMVTGYGTVSSKLKAREALQELRRLGKK